MTGSPKTRAVKIGNENKGSETRKMELYKRRISNMAQRKEEKRRTTQSQIRGQATDAKSKLDSERSDTRKRMLE